MKKYIITNDWKTQFVKMSILFKLIYRYMQFQLKFQHTYIFVELDELIPRCLLKCKDIEYTGQLCRKTVGGLTSQISRLTTVN